MIFPPEILLTLDLKEISIVIAIKNDWKEIQKQLFTQYNISESVLFRIEEEFVDYSDQESVCVCFKKLIIVWYGGGVGNQMFQYALAKCFMEQGNYVTGYITNYSLRSKREFELTSVFPNTVLNKCSNTTRLYYEKIIKLQYKEPAFGKINCLEADIRILNNTRGIFQGCWQSYQFAEMYRQELQKDYKFKEKKDNKLKKMINQITKINAVSIHIRRGDYLQFPELYGNICTEKYYETAIEYINKRVETPVFYFFSNDIEWVKEIYKKVSKAVFVQENMFEDYEDWYDMCLMSWCKHNIIANSTFSWWGAWLNRNNDKIVIAPQKWINGTEVLDIYPKEWIKIEPK